ncbi:hypothetical protein [Rickettsiales endosymbiont of Stachyamoeba lipophora]|uniref:hypothetical protein n=1 Tax=Rickettsiales endosymbiont of Stachyamoeba lipophora TaxID=2486578 RepID=UPI000F6475BF|nr:hypothetical protein [Rickettsiales endosymbiont of Stachyamoeba lipophora]AZL16316.1 hypothetical protein EF513_07235 [Rickettsiales endosymbiont of Stachyamoeba lipophora]
MASNYREKLKTIFKNSIAFLTSNGTFYIYSTITTSVLLIISLITTVGIPLAVVGFVGNLVAIGAKVTSEFIKSYKERKLDRAKDQIIEIKKGKAAAEIIKSFANTEGKITSSVHSNLAVSQQQLLFTQQDFQNFNTKKINKAIKQDLMVLFKPQFKIGKLTANILSHNLIVNILPMAFDWIPIIVNFNPINLAMSAVFSSISMISSSLHVSKYFLEEYKKESKLSLELQQIVTNEQDLGYIYDKAVLDQRLLEVYQHCEQDCEQGSNLEFFFSNLEEIKQQLLEDYSKKHTPTFLQDFVHDTKQTFAKVFNLTAPSKSKDYLDEIETKVQNYTKTLISSSYTKNQGEDEAQSTTTNKFTKVIGKSVKNVISSPASILKRIKSRDSSSSPDQWR